MRRLLRSEKAWSAAGVAGRRCRASASGRAAPSYRGSARRVVAQRPAHGHSSPGRVFTCQRTATSTRTRPPCHRRRPPRRWCPRRATTEAPPGCGRSCAAAGLDLLHRRPVQAEHEPRGRGRSARAARADPELLGHAVDRGAPGAVDGEQGIGHLGRRGHDVHEPDLGRGAHLRRDVPQLVLGDGRASETIRSSPQ